jgi:hypothetical protein
MAASLDRQGSQCCHRISAPRMMVQVKRDKAVGHIPTVGTQTEFRTEELETSLTAHTTRQKSVASLTRTYAARR